MAQRSGITKHLDGSSCSLHCITKPYKEVVHQPNIVVEVGSENEFTTRDHSSSDLVSPKGILESGIEDSWTHTPAPSIEEVFRDVEVPSWREQLTTRAIISSCILTPPFSFIILKFNLSTGVVPNLNISVAFLGFFMIKAWNKILQVLGLAQRCFTRQENVIMLTCIMTASNIANNGGFGSYLFAMSDTMAKQVDQDNKLINVHDMDFHTSLEYLLVVAFVGIFPAFLLRKIMITKFKLGYPTGTTTAELLNSFHTPRGSDLVKKHMKLFWISAPASFVWGWIQWSTAAENGCGLKNYPLFGLTAFKNKFYFDSSCTYVGVGMITPSEVSLSMLFGAVVSYGVMWPLIATKRGKWFDASLSDNSFSGMQGYRVFISTAIAFIDGLFKLGLAMYECGNEVCKPKYAKNTPKKNALTFNDERRNQFFRDDGMPTWVVIGFYVSLVIGCVVILPYVYIRIQWYHILFLQTISLILAFCNAYGCGLSDWSLVNTYGRLLTFIMSRWVGPDGGVVVGMASSGVVINMISNAADLTQDHKTGYLTLASPFAMVVPQVIGTLMGCVIAPCMFWIFTRAFSDLGVIGSDYPVPNAQVFRNMAIIGVEGGKVLPKYCDLFCTIAIVGTILINLICESIWDEEEQEMDQVHSPPYTYGYPSLHRGLLHF